MSRINISRVHRNPRFLTTITIERPSEDGGYDSNGVWGNGDPAYYTAQVSMQPADARVLRNLPEGERNSEAFEIFSDKVLRISEPSDKITADFVRLYRGKDWKVIRSEYWDDYGSHYAVIVRTTNRPEIPAGATIDELP